MAAPDLAGPALQRVLNGHGGAVTGVVVAPDGRWLVSASEDGRVRVWDPGTGQDEPC